MAYWSEAIYTGIARKAAYYDRTLDDTLRRPAMPTRCVPASPRCAARTTGGTRAAALRGALDRLGEITGRIDNERMLDRRFATFCIGK